MEQINPCSQQTPIIPTNRQPGEADEEEITYTHTLAFSPKGGYLAFSMGTSAVYTWDMTSQKCARVLTKHTQAVTCIACSSLGYLASGSQDTWICIWQPLSGELISVFKAHIGGVQAIAFTALGGCLASASSRADEPINIWNPMTGECSLSLGRSPNIRDLMYDHTDRLLSLSRERIIQVWDTTSDSSEVLLPGKTNDVTSFACASRKSFFALGTAQGAVGVWSMEQKPLWCHQGHKFQVDSVVLSQTDASLASGSLDKTVRIWEVMTGKLLYIFKHQDRVSGVVRASEGNVLASVSEDGKTIRIWNIPHKHTYSIRRRDK